VLQAHAGWEGGWIDEITRSMPECRIEVSSLSTVITATHQRVWWADKRLIFIAGGTRADKPKISQFD